MAHFTRTEALALERLRARFLKAEPGSDYWRDEGDLALYDETFGARIGWKCDAVFSELTVRGWTPRAREVMRTVLLKDPEMRDRITRPPPPEATGPEVEEGSIGAAPEPAIEAPAAPAPSRPRTPTATSGPRPYLANGQ